MVLGETVQDSRSHGIRCNSRLLGEMLGEMILGETTSRTLFILCKKCELILKKTPHHIRIYKMLLRMFQDRLISHSAFFLESSFRFRVGTSVIGFDRRQHAQEEILNN